MEGYEDIIRTAVPLQTMVYRGDVVDRKTGNTIITNTFCVDTIVEDNIREMTIEEIEGQLWHKIKIISKE